MLLAQCQPHRLGTPHSVTCHAVDMANPGETATPPSDSRDARRFWVRLRGSGQTAFIVRDTHTGPGRFVIHVDGEEGPRNCSQYELAEVSVETALWLSGYLYGSVPRWPVDDECLMTEWREKREIFLRCGAWPGRDDYTDYGTAHALSVGAEVRVESRAGSDAELEAARGRVGMIDNLALPEDGEDPLEYLVMLDAAGDAGGEVWAIAEEDLVATGQHRQDYEPDPRFACPCCGFLTLRSEDRGSYEICKVCFWEDDEVQLRDPDLAGGANSVSLNQARETFKHEGVSELRFKDKVRRPAAWECPRPAVVSPDGTPMPFDWPRL